MRMLKCNSKVAVDEDDEEMGECVRCKMIQCICDAEKGVTATLTLKPQGGKTITLHAFNKVLKSIAEVTRPVTHKSLLKAHPFGM